MFACHVLNLTGRNPTNGTYEWRSGERVGVSVRPTYQRTHTTPAQNTKYRKMLYIYSTLTNYSKNWPAYTESRVHLFSCFTESKSPDATKLTVPEET